MPTSIWAEAANRRLRALLWKRCSIEEIALMLDRSAADVLAQMRQLGLVQRDRQHA